MAVHEDLSPILPKVNTESTIWIVHAGLVISSQRLSGGVGDHGTTAVTPVSKTLSDRIPGRLNARIRWMGGNTDTAVKAGGIEDTRSRPDAQGGSRDPLQGLHNHRAKVIRWARWDGCL